MYSPESSVRKTGSYIYEEFMPTDGTDVKVKKPHTHFPDGHSWSVRPQVNAESGVPYAVPCCMSSGVHCGA